MIKLLIALMLFAAMFVLNIGCEREVNRHYYKLGDRRVISCGDASNWSCGIDLRSCSDGINHLCSTNLEDLGEVKR